MKLDFRGLENLIKCSNKDCKYKILQESVVLLKPCYEFYCLDHFRCKQKDCEFCLVNKFANDSFKSKQNFCNIEKTLSNKLAMCHICKREHKNLNEFQIEDLGYELISFIEKIRNDKNRFKINEPTKQSSYVSLHKKSSQTKTNGEDLDLFIKTVAESTVDILKKKLKMYLNNKKMHQDLIDQTRTEFDGLNKEIGTKYYEIKLEYLSGIKNYFSSCQERMTSDIPKRILEIIQNYEEGYQRLEKIIFNLDRNNIRELKRHYKAESIKLNLYLNDIKSMIGLQEKYEKPINLDEIKQKFGFFKYKIPRSVETKNFIEFECPCLESSEVFQSSLRNLEFKTYWMIDKLVTEIKIKNFNEHVK